MKHFYVEPEVAGGLGQHTLMNKSVHPPVVSRLHYQFDGWLGDVLLESFPSFIVTELAKQKCEAAQLTGAKYDDVEITTSKEFQQLNRAQQLPKFVWLRVDGQPGQSDFGIAPDGRLVISERALEVLRELGASHALVSEYG